MADLAYGVMLSLCVIMAILIILSLTIFACMEFAGPFGNSSESNKPLAIFIVVLTVFHVLLMALMLSGKPAAYLMMMGASVVDVCIVGWCAKRPEIIGLFPIINIFLLMGALALLGRKSRVRMAIPEGFEELEGLVKKSGEGNDKAD